MIDARGLACPQPVILLKKEVDKNHPKTIHILVDDPCAAENIHRFAFHSGYNFAMKAESDHDSITLERKS